MKIKLIVSSDKNPSYLGFVKIQEQVCKNVGLDFFLCRTGCKSWSLSENKVEVPKIYGIPDIFVAQVIRYIIPAFFPDKKFIVGDIDMIFLSKNYIKNLINLVNHDESFWLIDSNRYQYENILRFPCCYYLATGEKFAKILKLKKPNWNNCKNLIKAIWARGEGWGSDEFFISEAILLASSSIVVRHYNKRHNSSFNKGAYPKGRINRSNWKYSRIGLFLNSYIDAHMLRPIENHINELRHILNYVYCGMNGYTYLKYEISRFFKKRDDLFLYKL